MLEDQIQNNADLPNNERHENTRDFGEKMKEIVSNRIRRESQNKNVSKLYTGVNAVSMQRDETKKKVTYNRISIVKPT
jgi:ribosome-binding factor A